MQAHVEEQLKQKECKEDMIFEHCKQEDEDTNTESGNDSSENGAGDGFQHFQDYTPCSYGLGQLYQPLQA